MESFSVLLRLSGESASSLRLRRETARHSAGRDGVCLVL